MKMNKARKSALLKALRTPIDEGGYHQAQGQLYMYIDVDEATDSELDEPIDAFCCLGVMTNLAVIDGITRWDAVAVSPSNDPAFVDCDGSALTRSEARNIAKPGSKIVKFDDGFEPKWRVYSTINEESAMPSAEVMVYFGISTEVATEMARRNDWVEATL
jgi:hypothetical protein